jgi:hypothetical protein
MASGRLRHPDDPRVTASVVTALGMVAQLGLITWVWHWRYELALIMGLPLAALAIGYTLGLTWLLGIAAAAATVLVAAALWPPSRRRLIARAWCVITPHRVRTGCAQAWIQTTDGRLPTVLYTTPAPFGERVMLWCRAGITARDLVAARDILRAACWASDVRVLVNDRRSHIVLLEVMRLPAGRPAAGTPGQDGPHQDRDEADGAPGEPAAYAGLGLHRPAG